MQDRAAVIRGLPIRPDDFVVEVGGGGQPYDGSNIVFDKYPFDNVERDADISPNVPVAIADATKLPLLDDQCDVLFMSHVVEHLDDPMLFLGEAKRCARSIYLEFPAFQRELMAAWPFHRWLVIADENVLRFFENDIPQLFGDFFFRNFDLLQKVWRDRRFEEFNQHVFVATADLEFVIEKKTAFEYIVDQAGTDKVLYRTEYSDGVGSIPYSMAERLKIAVWALTPPFLLQLRMRKRTRIRSKVNYPPITRDLLEHMACVRCGGSLAFSGSTSNQTVKCLSCDHEFIQDRGIFNFDYDGSTVTG